MHPHPRFRGLLLSLVLSGGIACKGSADDAPKAEVAEAAKAPGPSSEPTNGAVPEGALSFDPAASEVAFVAAKITSEHEGHFEQLAGWVVLDGETPASLAVTVQTESVQIEPGMLERHLKSDDFLAVEEHPTASFSSTKIEAKPSGEATHELTGTLEMRGVAKQVAFPAKVTVDADAVTGSAEFAIERKQWGIVYRGMPDDLIADEVVLKIELRAPRS